MRTVSRARGRMLQQAAGYPSADALSRLAIPAPPRTAGPPRPRRSACSTSTCPKQRQPGEARRRLRAPRRRARRPVPACCRSSAIPTRVVLGADTEVVLDDEVFGKPRDADDAAAMLRRLSGRTHQVISAVSLVVGRARAAGGVGLRSHLRRARRCRASPPTSPAASRRARPARYAIQGARAGVHRAPVGQLFRRDGPAAVRDRATLLRAFGLRPALDARA